MRSKNRGKKWDPDAKIVVPSFVNNLVFTGGYTYDSDGNITGGVGTLMRNDQTVPSYNVNPNNGFYMLPINQVSLEPINCSKLALSPRVMVVTPGQREYR